MRVLVCIDGHEEWLAKFKVRWWSAKSFIQSSRYSLKVTTILNKKILKTHTLTQDIPHISPYTMFQRNKINSLSSVNFASNSNSPDDARDSRSLVLQSNNSTLPVLSRKVRDSGSFFVFLFFLGFLAYVLWDGLILKKIDINLIVHGHDSYGNICGRVNKPIAGVHQSGKNFTSSPYTKYTLINAQFERYSIESSKSNKSSGFEIYLVKDNSSKLFKYRSKRQVSAQELEKTLLLRLLNRKALLNSAQKLQRQASIAEINGIGNGIDVVDARYKAVVLTEGSLAGSTTTTTTTKKSTNESTLKTTLKDSVQENVTKRQGTYPEYIATSATNAGQQDTRRQTHSFQQHNQARQLQNAAGSAVEFDDTNNFQSDNQDHVFVSGKVGQGVYHDTQLASKPLNDGTSLNTGTAAAAAAAASPSFSNEVESQLLYLTECVNQCPSDHSELIFYRCMPKNWRFSMFPSAINVTTNFIEEVLADLSHCHKELVYIFSLALLMSLTLLILLRYLASLIIWSCITMLVSLFVSIAAYSWSNYYYIIMDLNNSNPSRDKFYADKLASSDKWLLGSMFVTFVSFAAIATVTFMRKRILVVTMLFRESGKAIADMPLLLIQPILTFAVLCLITSLWCLGLICFQSMKSPVIDLSTGFVVFKAETLYKVMKWYHVFAYLWLCHFAIACQHYVIGASVSKWYFSTDRYNLNSPIGSSVSELILYYLGSVALGSFLVAIFKVIRIITRQIQALMHNNCVGSGSSSSQSSSIVGQDGPNFDSSNTRASNFLNSASSASNSVSCCGSLSYVVRAFGWFLDNIVMAINRDAYVEISIYGGSFMDSAKRALRIMTLNPFRLLAVKTVGNTLLIVAKICIVLATTGVAVALLNDVTYKLKYWWVPVLISATYAYIVAHWFLSVYDMVIDALFICYCEDYERSKNDRGFKRINGNSVMANIVDNTINNNTPANQNVQAA